MTYNFSAGYKIRDQSATHFLTFTTIDWIDIFSRQKYRDLLIESMDHCRKSKGLKVGAYVIMTNHIHVIWTADGNLSDILRDFKTFTSRAIFNAIQSESESRRDWLMHMIKFRARQSNKHEMFRIWTGDNHPEEIHTMKFLHTKLIYIHENPVRAGWVKEPEDYLYSSASNYKRNCGLMDIDYLF
ncbi:MAG: transposase [Chitinophagaceae bacterium]|nr:transposase [Chitinophagaceae bacterium]MBN8667322.1 transposase [Chitinophagales bacterium]